MDGKRWRRLKWIAACGSIGVDPPGKGGEGREMKGRVVLMMVHMGGPPERAAFFMKGIENSQVEVYARVGKSAI